MHRRMVVYEFMHKSMAAVVKCVQLLCCVVCVCKYMTWYYLAILLSLIAVTINSKDCYEIIELNDILHSIKQPCSSVCLKQYCTLAKQSVKSNICSTTSKISKFFLPAC